MIWPSSQLWAALSETSSQSESLQKCQWLSASHLQSELKLWLEPVRAAARAYAGISARSIASARSADRIRCLICYLLVFICLGELSVSMHPLFCL